MKLRLSLRILLGIQSLMYALAILIMYVSSHDDVDDFFGLNALIPLGIFGLLGLINLVLFVAYLIRLARKKVPVDKIMLSLVFLNILFVLVYEYANSWALSGPG